MIREQSASQKRHSTFIPAAQMLKTSSSLAQMRRSSTANQLQFAFAKKLDAS